MAKVNKAVQTRQARKAFSKKYGPNTLGIIGLVNKGVASSLIATKYGITIYAVAAVKAHVTMGTYATALKGCNI